MVEAMDHINATHIEIDNRWNIVHKCTFIEHLQYLEERNKKIHKANQNIANIFSNLSIAMCHAFIHDEKHLPPPMNFNLVSSGEEWFRYEASDLLTNQMI
jgi:hypothetical protein